MEAALITTAEVRRAQSRARWVLPVPAGPTRASRPSGQAGQASSPSSASALVGDDANDSRSQRGGTVSGSRNWRGKAASGQGYSVTGDIGPASGQGEVGGRFGWG